MGTMKKVTIKALERLRAESGEHVEVGGITEVLESTAKILIDKKQAVLVTQKKD